jgi:hypothetical protein
MFPIFSPKYVLLTIAQVLFTILAYCGGNLFAVLFCKADGNLPTWLKWFQTFDATCDAGWKDGYFLNLSDREYVNPEGFLLYLLRVKWLYRNPAYGFSYGPCGIAFVPGDWTIQNVVLDDTTGNVLYLYATDTKGHYCLMTEAGGKYGWKILNYIDHWQGRNPVWKTSPWGPQWRTMIAFTPKV